MAVCVYMYNSQNLGQHKNFSQFIIMELSNLQKDIDTKNQI